MDMETTDWSPERKVMGAAVAVLVLGVVQVATTWEFPAGLEGALAVVVAYFLPNKR